jgi:hypothetical protein
MEQQKYTEKHEKMKCKYKNLKMKYNDKVGISYYRFPKSDKRHIFIYSRILAQYVGTYL